jgi:hypothetical protein
MMRLMRARCWESLSRILRREDEFCARACNFFRAAGMYVFERCSVDGLSKGTRDDYCQRSA